jgi:hypothetical protein
LRCLIVIPDSLQQPGFRVHKTTAGRRCGEASARMKLLWNRLIHTAKIILFFTVAR